MSGKQCARCCVIITCENADFTCAKGEFVPIFLSVPGWDGKSLCNKCRHEMISIQDMGSINLINGKIDKLIVSMNDAVEKINRLENTCQVLGESINIVKRKNEGLEVIINIVVADAVNLSDDVKKINSMLGRKVEQNGTQIVECKENVKELVCDEGQIVKDDELHVSDSDNVVCKESVKGLVCDDGQIVNNNDQCEEHISDSGNVEWCESTVSDSGNIECCKSCVSDSGNVECYGPPVFDNGNIECCKQYMFEKYLIDIDKHRDKEQIICCRESCCKEVYVPQKKSAFQLLEQIIEYEKCDYDNERLFDVEDIKCP